MAMKKKELDKFRELLNEEKRKIMRHLSDLSESSEQQTEDTSTGDPVDIASMEINQSNLQKIGKRETYLLKKIDLALAKIDEGTFGDCEVCGEPIAQGRLLARPVAQLCIDCKTEQENIERRFTSRDRSEDEDGEGGEESEEG